MVLLKSEQPEPLDEKAAWQLALSLLARQELSAAALQQKLQQKGAPLQIAATVLARCQQDNLQSDQRYAGMLLRHCLQKGQGLLLIRQVFHEKAVSKELLAAEIEEQQVDWFAQARSCYLRKFGDTVPTEQKEQLKRKAYLSRKGFTYEQIRFATEHQDY
jgi:regulatory protein